MEQYLIIGLVDCPTQLTLFLIFRYLYLSVYITNIKVTNMKEIQQENLLLLDGSTECCYSNYLLFGKASFTLGSPIKTEINLQSFYGKKF